MATSAVKQGGVWCQELLRQPGLSQPKAPSLPHMLISSVLLHMRSDFGETEGAGCYCTQPREDEQYPSPETPLPLKMLAELHWVSVASVSHLVVSKDPNVK